MARAWSGGYTASRCAKPVAALSWASPTSGRGLEVIVASAKSRSKGVTGSLRGHSGKTMATSSFAVVTCSATSWAWREGKRGVAADATPEETVTEQ